MGENSSVVCVCEWVPQLKRKRFLSVYFILTASLHFNLNVRYDILSSSFLYDNKLKWPDTAHGYIFNRLSVMYRN